TGGNQMDVRAEQVIEQVIALQGWSRLAGGEDERDPETGRARRGGRHARVIRLERAAGHERRRALPQRVADQKLELPRLVAAERQAGEVVALQKNARAPS